MNNQYHIDVSTEEDILFQDKLPQNNKNIKTEYNLFKNWIFWSVVLIHLSVFSILAIAAPKKETNIKEPPITEEQKPTPTPSPSNDVPMDSKPEPLKEETKPPVPQVKPPVPQVKPPVPQVKPPVPQVKTEVKNQLIKEYVIKSGDTVFSVAKKYKLNYDRLIKINNIQDPNKVVVGQKLRFL